MSSAQVILQFDAVPKMLVLETQGISNFNWIRESAIDPSLFILQRSSIVGYLFIYVDDIVVVGANDKEVDGMVVKLANEFPIRDLG